MEKETSKLQVIIETRCDSPRVCFMCQTTKEPLTVDNGYVACEECAAMLRGFVVLYCTNCGNLQMIDRVPEMDERIAYYHDNGYMIAEAFGSTFIYYDNCPRCVGASQGGKA